MQILDPEHHLNSTLQNMCVWEMAQRVTGNLRVKIPSMPVIPMLAREDRESPGFNRRPRSPTVEDDWGGRFHSTSGPHTHVYTPARTLIRRSAPPMYIGNINPLKNLQITFMEKRALKSGWWPLAHIRHVIVQTRTVACWCAFSIDSLWPYRYSGLHACAQDHRPVHRKQAAENTRC